MFTHLETVGQNDFLTSKVFDDFVVWYNWQTRQQRRVKETIEVLKKFREFCKKRPAEMTVEEVKEMGDIGGVKEVRVYPAQRRRGKIKEVLGFLIKKNASPATVRNYRSDLNQFFIFLDSYFPEIEIDESFVW